MPIAPEGANLPSSEPPSAAPCAVVYRVKRSGYELTLTAAMPSPDGQTWEQTSLQVCLRGRGEGSAIVLNWKELEGFWGDVQGLMQYLRWERATQQAAQGDQGQAAARPERKPPKRNSRVGRAQQAKHTTTSGQNRRRTNPRRQQKPTSAPEEP